MLDRSVVGFQELPYDIIFAISQYLDVEDAVSICYTCRRLKENLLEQGHMCQAVLEVRDAVRFHQNAFDYYTLWSKSVALKNFQRAISLLSNVCLL